MAKKQIEQIAEESLGVETSVPNQNEPKFDLSYLCTWKQISWIKDSPTFQEATRRDKAYQCFLCEGLENNNRCEGVNYLSGKYFRGTGEYGE